MSQYFCATKQDPVAGTDHHGLLVCSVHVSCNHGLAPDMQGSNRIFANICRTAGLPSLREAIHIFSDALPASLLELRSDLHVDCACKPCLQHTCRHALA